MKNQEYALGVRRGLPVALGYFSVSFGFGAMAVSKGLTVFQAAAISASNYTSAGQFAGVSSIVEQSGLWVVILTQLIINSRYALMSLALSQRLGQKVGLLPYVGWLSGTVLGAAAGAVLPLSIRRALGVMLYGMFVAIVIPPAKREKSVALAAALAVLLSSLFAWVPLLQKTPTGLPIVICTVAAAAVCAWLFPVEEKEV